MSQSGNPLSTVAPWDLVAEGYAEITKGLFEHYADRAIALADLSEDSHVLDVACGPGTLALKASAKVRSVQAVDFSTAMLRLLQQTLDEQGIANVRLACEDCQQLPFDDNTFDAAFSMFGLMFFPDRLEGHREILRTLKPGGTTLISSWAPVSRSTVMQAIFGALRAINPNVPEPEADVESLESLEFFHSELEAAGFTSIGVLEVDHTVRFETAESFWADMVKGSAPILMMKESVSADQWAAMSEVAVGFVKDRFGSRDLSLNAMANFGMGRKPR